MWRRVSRLDSGIRADTVFDEQAHVDRREFSEIERSPFRESDDYAFHIGRHTIVARDVYYLDVRAVCCVSRVISGVRADTVSDVQPHVDRRGLWRVSRGTALLLHHVGHSWLA